MQEQLKFDLQMFTTTPSKVDVITNATNTNIVATKDNRGGTEDVVGGKGNFGKLLEPGLRKIFFETYQEVPEQYSKLFKVNSSNKAVETDYGMGAFGDWTVRSSEVDTVAYKTLSSGKTRTYTHSAFTQGFQVTREMADDDLYRQIAKMPQAMARAGRGKVEKDAAGFLATAFSATQYDGKALIAKDHGLLDSVATASNKILSTDLGSGTASTALSLDSLKAGLLKMRSTVDEAGLLAQFTPTQLIVPPALEDAAIRITESDKVVGSNNNDTNRYINKFGLEIVVMDFLSSTVTGNADTDGYWFLADGNRHELNFFWRVRPEFKMEENFDNFASKYRGYMRYSYGASDWRGLVGSTGKSSVTT
jgi:phage major head subunit gpT-like protein